MTRDCDQLCLCWPLEETPKDMVRNAKSPRSVRERLKSLRRDVTQHEGPVAFVPAVMCPMTSSQRVLAAFSASCRVGGPEEAIAASIALALLGNRC